MYGKVFEDIFCSTLMDCGGDTAYVFIAMIVLSDENGVIKHTPESLARLICKDPETVKKAIDHLERQDQRSNLKGHGGRRIVPLNQICDDETRGWLVVNKAYYRDKRDPTERRDYMREYMRKYREDKDVNSRKPQLAQLAHTDTDTDTELHRPKTYPDAFEVLWKAYPKRIGGNPKDKAYAAYRSRLAEGKTPAEILDGVSRYARYCESLGKVGSEYVMQAKTFLGPSCNFNETWATPQDAAPKITVDL